MKRIQRGFALIELMIVVVIIGLLAAVVLPPIRRLISFGGLCQSLLTTTGTRQTLAMHNRHGWSIFVWP